MTEQPAKQSPLLPIALAAGMWWYAGMPGLDKLPLPTPEAAAAAVTKPAETFGLDNLGSEIKVKADRARLSAFFTALADGIEADGKRDKPTLLWVASVWDAEAFGVANVFGKRLGEAYPSVSTKLAAVMESKLGKPADELTADKRATAVAVFRAAAWGVK